MHAKYRACTRKETDHRNSEVHVYLRYRRRMSQDFGNIWRVAAIASRHIATTYSSSISSFRTSGTSRRVANVRHQATELRLAHIVNDVYDTVKKCVSSIQSHWIIYKRRTLWLFPAAGTLDLIPIEILGGLIMTEGKNKYIVVVMNCCSKLTKSILASKTTVTTIANIFMEHQVVKFKITSTVLTINEPKFTSKLFAALFKELEVRTVATTEHHPLAYGQVERLNAIMKSWLTAYVADHQRDWNTSCFQWRNCTTYRSIKTQSCPHSVWLIIHLSLHLLLYHAYCRQTSARMTHRSPIDSV